MELSIKDFILKNKTLFEDVAKDYENIDHKHDTKYSILNYDKILSEMIEYVKGYVKYSDTGDDKYSGKIISSTFGFYNNMFSDIKYRTVITLHDFKSNTKSFLEKTKELQSLLETYSDDCGRTELCSLCAMTDKQYRKVSKVYADDMKIYLWLISSNSKIFKKDISPELKQHFHDKSTPVMHVKPDKYK